MKTLLSLVAVAIISSCIFISCGKTDTQVAKKEANIPRKNAKAIAFQLSGTGNVYTVRQTDCIGPAKKIVNGICETGRKVWTGSSHQGTRWYCYFHYAFSDGSVSSTQVISSNFPCITPVE